MVQPLPAASFQTSSDQPAAPLAGASQGAAAPLSSGPPAPNTLSGPPAPNTLLDGTAVKMRLGKTLSSEHETVGEQVPFEVTDDVVVDRAVVIPKGTAALATVTVAEPKKRMGRGGKLDVNIDSTRLVDGEKVQLRAVQNNQGGGHIGLMAGAMAGTAILFFPAAPLFLLMHGKEVTIPKGTEVTAFVQGDMRLDMAQMVAPGTPAGSDAGQAAAGMANLRVDSNVAGADIEVDGAFVGSTPSTVSVTPGQHTIAVKKKGYGDWSRAMSVAGSGVRVNAELEATP